jgi:hypothetical protein
MDERAYYRLELDVEVEDAEKAKRVASAINAAKRGARPRAAQLHQ